MPIGEVDADVIQRVAMWVYRGLEHETVEDRLRNGRILKVARHRKRCVQAGHFLLFTLVEHPLVEDAEQGLEDEVVGVHGLVEVGEIGRDDE